LCHTLQLDPHLASRLCTLFLALRAAYVPLYIFGVHWTIGVCRSLVWTAAVYVSVRLTLLSLAKAGL
jgi:uncharacterized MAPEG superfamily protein